MHPPAEDNYGLDACSICCLHSNPPVLVVATSTGLLHHCVLLSTTDDEEALVSQIFTFVMFVLLIHGTVCEGKSYLSTDPLVAYLAAITTIR